MFIWRIPSDQITYKNIQPEDFNSLPAHSRIWVYQSERFFNDNELATIKQKASEFIDQWTSHGNQMDACIEVLHNCFIIVVVDEKTAPASGCGIDKSVHFIQSLEKEVKLSLMERTNVAYRNYENKINLCSLKEFEQLIDSGVVTDNTIVFNNLLSIKEELLSKWEIPVFRSWLLK